MAFVEEDWAATRAKIKILRRERLAYDQESIKTRQALARSEAYSRALVARIRLLETQALEAGARVDTLEDTENGTKKRTTRLNPETTPAATAATTTTVTNAQLQAMIDQGVTVFLAARDANTNGVDSHNSRTGARRNERATRNALTWWNSHVRTVGNDIAYAMTWTELKKKMTDKYCPRTKIKKLEVKLWELKVKGTDVIGYNQLFLALLCGIMFPEESDKIEKYVSGLPDMIYESVVASKPKTMQEATEMAIEVMDKRIHTFANFGHFARDYRSMANANHANYQRGMGSGQKHTCFECEAQGHFKRECPKLKNNNNCGNQVGGGNAPAKVYAVGHAGTNPDSNVVT
ncbi:putative reverse transcriptase domain-containing protein, partial [Tanacetum coccineum]